MLWVTSEEFAEDADDLVANFLLHTVQHLYIGAQAAIYQIGQGMIKLWLIVGLLQQRLWYYPVSMIVLSIAYQV